jgi:hypothetical protein
MLAALSPHMATRAQVIRFLRIIRQSPARLGAMMRNAMIPLAKF